jgi:MarR family transcriptional regulator, organic hydroperoxide resistance regulator
MTPEERDALVYRALGANERIMRGMLAQADADPWIQLDMSMAQCKAMLFLCQEGASTIGGVADRLGIGRPAASNLVERLVQQGLAHREEDPADRRRTVATLTSTGQELAGRLQQLHVTQLRTYMSQLLDEDLAALVQGAEALARVLTEPVSDAVTAGGIS